MLVGNSGGEFGVRGWLKALDANDGRVVWTAYSTGQAKWAYQLNPRDLYDHDEVNENILLDLPIDGQTRKTLIHPGRNGYIYILDRTTGEVLSYTPYVRVSAEAG